MKSCNRILSAALRLCGLILLTVYCLLPTAYSQSQWVNPFIGTGGHGHTFPGATMPFGMVQLSPDTRTDNWDGSSGYHYSDDTIYGFSHTHLSGTGIPDYCDILFMPFSFGDGGKINAKPNYPARFSHANEKAEPGYYSVKLDGSNILAELTTTKRVGLHRYTFSNSKDSWVLLDMAWRDKVVDSGYTVVGNNRIEGYRRSSSWAKDQVIYFVAEFSKPFSRALIPKANSLERTDIKNQKKEDRVQGVGDKPMFEFVAEQVLLKVALSSVSIEGARKNLAAELPGWDFDKVRADANAAWNKELSKIEVSGGIDAQTMTFYTALYHTMIQPNVFNDVDGNYRGLDGKTHNIGATTPSAEAAATPPKQGGELKTANPKSKIQNPKSGDQYTVFSLWDTFRAAHPLYTIIDQRRTVDFINTFIRQYEQGGRLPVWELAGNETDCMIGYHAVSVIADAMAKGIKGFDYEKAYAAAKHSAELDHFGLASYKKRGYISMEDENESVSKTLEYAYDDWCIAQMAKIVLAKKMSETKAKKTSEGDPFEGIHAFHNLKKDELVFTERARRFENLFDPSTGFMRPKKNGGFVSPFAPNEVTFNFTEGNSWVYSFFVPHDITRLMELQGGREKFAAKLDELFTTKDKLAGREQPDITGLIGQYAHGNEPSHHIAYLYDYAQQPWKTQNLVRKIMDEFYKPQPDGLIGNEDCGQMSAWYIMSASGIYEVTPGSAIYAFGTPLFPEIKYKLENGKTFTVKAKNVSSTNKYILNAKLNGAPYKKAFIAHEDMMKGGVLEFSMIDTPVTTAFTEFPVSGSSTPSVAVPAIEGGGRVFSKTTTITINATTPGAKIFVRTDGVDLDPPWFLYSRPFEISLSTRIFAKTVNPDGSESPIVDATFIKKPNYWTVKIDSKYNRQYTGGGDEGLIDGIRGTVNFASGEWQGYQPQDLVATIDLQRETEIKRVGGGFLQNARSWIWMPTHIEFEVSSDGANFTKVADIKTDIAPDDMKEQIRDFVQTIKPIKTRYVRVHAYNLGKIPSWHPGAGDDAFIFVDEILIN